MLTPEQSAILAAARTLDEIATRAHAQLQAVESELDGQMTPDQLGAILAIACAYGEAEAAFTSALAA